MNDDDDVGEALLLSGCFNCDKLLILSAGYRGARLIVGSDVFEVFEDMTCVLGNSTSFTEVQGGREADWPLERRTERQTSCSERGEALYHAVYTRS